MLLAYLWIINAVNSQTFVEPMIGISTSKNQGFSTGAYPLNDVVSDDRFERRNILYGINLAQNFTDRFSLKLSGNYSKQSVRYSDSGFVGYTDVKYLKYNFSAVLNYKLIANLIIGIGRGTNQLRNFEIGKEQEDIWSSLDERYNQNQIGWITSIGYFQKPIMIELRYSNFISKNSEDHQFINKTNLVEIQVSYRIKIVNKWRL